MSEELEKKAKKSFKYQIEDFNPPSFRRWGVSNYLLRVSDNFTYTLEESGEKTKCLLGVIGLLSFNLAMFTGVICLDNYLINQLIK